MTRKKFLVLFLLLALFSFPLLSMAAATGPDCPAVLQRGETKIKIMPALTSGSVDLAITQCPGHNVNVQVTGGTMHQVPVIINATVHQGQLRISAQLLAPQPGPTDVIVWWRVD